MGPFIVFFSNVVIYIILEIVKKTYESKKKFQIPDDIYECLIKKSILVSKKGAFMGVLLKLLHFFQYKILKYEVYEFNFVLHNF